MTDEDTQKLILSCNWGVLSVASKNWEPYGIPLNYVFLPEENVLCLHCANEGKKNDILKENSEVCFTIVGEAELNQKELTTHYKSAVIQGRARFVEDGDEKARYILKFCEVLAPQDTKIQKGEILKHISALSIIVIDIKEITGKKSPAKKA